VKDMLFKAARLPRGVIPASIKASKPYGKLRGKLQGLLASHNSIYDADNYARYVEPAAVQSAGPISNSIILQFSPKSVIDVGCGTGALLAAFRERGCLVAGIEYSDAALHYCRARGLIVTKFDIEQDITTPCSRGRNMDGHLEKFFSPSRCESDSLIAMGHGRMERASHGADGLFRC
jgi:SAM-dependent methyltransferase